MDNPDYQSPLPVEYKLFEKVNAGVIILDHQNRTIVFSNSHFKAIAGNNERLIVDTILNYLDVKNPLNVRIDKKIDSQLTIGYTIYKLPENQYLIFMGDISNRKIFFESREESNYYDWLSGLIAELIHELGNPLTSINTTLQVLNENVDQWNKEKSREYINRANNEIERLFFFLQKLRNFSSVSSIVDKQPYQLKLLIENVINQNKGILDLKSITINGNIDESIKVSVDKDVFYQVLMNLIHNSSDLLEDGGNIQIKVEEINEYFVKLIFRTNGSSIPKEILDKIFMPFYTTKREGSSIGLAVSLKLMTRMGGKIKAEIPKNGKGAKFVIYIPVST